MEVIKYEVVIKTDLKDRPKDHELSAALILADYFKSDVVFLWTFAESKCIKVKRRLA